MKDTDHTDCSKCGHSIPHRLVNEPSDPYVCVLCNPPKKSLGKQKSKILKLILLIGIATAGFFLQKCSYHKISELRQLSRIPQTQIMAAVPGEVNLSGRAQAAPDQSLLKAPDTHNECVYYDFRKERQERDSDGDVKWVTLEHRVEFTQFHLKDSTGLISVKPSKEVDFNIEVSHQRRSGNLRFTERRIDPSDRIFIFGYLVNNTQQVPVVRFTDDGDYHPLISEKTESSERHSRATVSIWLCWLGLGFFALATTLLFTLLGFHRILVFFGLLTFVISGTLAFQGVAMMVGDLSSSQNRVDKQFERVRHLIQKEFISHQLNWDGDWQSLGNLSDYKSLPAKSRTRLRRIRIDLAIASQRSKQQAEGFPYNLIQFFISTPQPPEIPLPKRDQEIMQKLNGAFEETKISSLMAMIGSGIALIIGVITLVRGFRKLKHKRLIENLPTTSTNGITYGLVEALGILDLPSPATSLTSPISSTSCVGYRHVIKEKRGSGKKSKWVTVHDEKKLAPFILRDRDGTIPVNPDSADINYCQKTTKREGRRMHIESLLPLGDPVYIMAFAQLNPDTGDSLHLAKYDSNSKQNHTPFIISGFLEKHLLRAGSFTSAFILNATFAAFLFAGLMLSAALGTFNPASYLTAALIGPTLMVLITICMYYNDLVFLNKRAKRNWANIDAALQKRNDLIPQLEHIAKQALAHEKALMSQLTDLRTDREKNPNHANKLSPRLTQSHQATKNIIATIENYPDLKTNSNLLYLSKQLITCENEIAFISASFNDAVETYNTRIASFPDILLAKAFSFQALTHLEQLPKKLHMPDLPIS